MDRQQAEDGVEVVVDFGDEDHDGPSSHLADDLIGSPLNRYHIQKTCQQNLYVNAFGERVPSSWKI